MSLDYCSMIFVGEVFHARYAPKSHSFTYPLFFLGIDPRHIDRELSHRPLLGVNRSSLCSIYESDYLAVGSRSIEDKLKDFGVDLKVDQRRVYLLTTPRLLGYVFNPVSFYIFVDSDLTVSEMIAEVHNTFGEKHVYHLKGQLNKEKLGSSEPISEFRFAKEFYVSPFLPIDGEYKITLGPWRGDLDLKVSLSRDGKETFVVQLKAQGRKFSTAALLSTLVRYPLSTVLTMSRIHFEAIRLVMFRNAKVFFKPSPFSPNTIRSEQTFVHRIRQGLLKMLSKFAGSREVLLFVLTGGVTYELFRCL